MSGDSIPVFVISLARAAERRAKMIRRLDEANVAYEITDAVDGAILDLSQLGERLDRKGQMRHLGRPMTRGEIGCYLSHYNLWRRMTDEQIPMAVILEDDATLKDGFAQAVAAVAACDYEWDVVLLHAPFRGTRRLVCNLGGDFQLMDYKRHYPRTTGYLVSLSGAKKLADYCRCMRLSIDVEWGRLHRWNGAFYYLTPRVVHHEGSDSIISQIAKEDGETHAPTRRWRFFRSLLKAHREFSLWFHFHTRRPKRKQ